MTRSECQPGVRVVVTSAAGATCSQPPDRRVWAQVVRGLLGRTGVVLDRRRSARMQAGEPTHLRARVRLDPREPETRTRVVDVPLSGLDLVRAEAVVEVPLAVPGWEADR